MPELGPYGSVRGGGEVTRVPTANIPREGREFRF